MDDVIRLLEKLKLNNFCRTFQDNLVDGLTLVNCTTVDHLIELGITFTAKANVLLEEINKLTEVSKLYFSLKA